MRDLARLAVAQDQPPSDEYRRLYRLWFAAGIPAFMAILVIVWLMLAKPVLW